MAATARTSTALAASGVCQDLCSSVCCLSFACAWGRAPCFRLTSLPALLCRRPAPRHAPYPLSTHPTPAGLDSVECTAHQRRARAPRACAGLRGRLHRNNARILARAADAGGGAHRVELGQHPALWLLGRRLRILRVLREDKGGWLRVRAVLRTRKRMWGAACTSRPVTAKTPSHTRRSSRG